MKIRSARTDQERMVAALRSTPDDWFKSPDENLVITGLNIEGERIYLGEVSIVDSYQFSMRAAIDRILFPPTIKD